MSDKFTKDDFIKAYNTMDALRGPVYFVTPKLEEQLSKAAEEYIKDWLKNDKDRNVFKRNKLKPVRR